MINFSNRAKEQIEEQEISIQKEREKFQGQTKKLQLQNELQLQEFHNEKKNFEEELALAQSRENIFIGFTLYRENSQFGRDQIESGIGFISH